MMKGGFMINFVIDMSFSLKWAFLLAMILLRTFMVMGQKRDGSAIDSAFQLASDSFPVNYESGLRLALESAQWAERAGDLSRAGRAHKLIGVSAYYKGDYERSLKHYHQAIDHYEKAKDSSGLAYTLNELGNYTKKHGTKEKAIEYLNQAMNIFERLSDESGIANSCNNLGVVYEMLNDTSHALQLYTRAFQLYASIPDSVGMSYGIDNMAGIYLIRKKYDKALALLARSVAIREKIHDEKALAITLNNMGEVYLSMQDPQGAIMYLERSLVLSAKTGFTDLRKHTMNLISEAYAATGNHKKAFEWQNAYAKLKDSLYNETMHRQITELSTKYETVKKEKENSLLREEKQVKELELSRKQNLIVLLVLSVALIVLSSIFIIYRIRAKQKELLAAERENQQQAQLKAVIETQERERKRIAEDLHDGIGQMLAGIRINMGQVAEATVSPAARQDEIKRSVQTLDEACSELRSISHQMMPKALSRHGLVPALEDLFSQTFTGTKINASFECHGEVPSLPDLTAINIYRIIQELTGNIIRHSSATQLQAQLIARKDALIMMMEDNGRPFDFETARRSSKGMGLSNILSRTQALNGTITFAAGPEGSGTIVNLRIPVYVAS